MCAVCVYVRRVCVLVRLRLKRTAFVCSWRPRKIPEGSQKDPRNIPANGKGKRSKPQLVENVVVHKPGDPAPVSPLLLPLVGWWVCLRGSSDRHVILLKFRSGQREKVRALRCVLILVRMIGSSDEVSQSVWRQLVWGEGGGVVLRFLAVPPSFVVRSVADGLH